MKRLIMIAALAGSLLLAAPADAGVSTYTPPCEQGNVQCDGESSDDVKPGAWCSFDHDDNAETPPLEGHTDHRGRCVCAVPPTTVPSTTSTVPPSTTTTTTAVAVSPTTQVVPPTTAFVAQPVAQPDTPASAPQELPRTGSDSNLILGFTGVGLVSLGFALVKARGLLPIRR